MSYCFYWVLHKFQSVYIFRANEAAAALNAEKILDPDYFPSASSSDSGSDGPDNEDILSQRYSTLCLFVWFCLVCLEKEGN